jgi:hypothetical protein
VVPPAPTPPAVRSLPGPDGQAHAGRGVTARSGAQLGLVVAAAGVVAGLVARRTASQLRRLREAGARVPALAHDTLLAGPGGAAATCTLVVVGDSAAAGHGLPDADAGLARQVGRRLVSRTGRAVEVVSLAVDGATTEDVHRDQVPSIPPRATVVLVGVGVNDAIRGRTPARVREVTERLLGAMRRQAPLAAVVLLSCPDLAAAPGLPAVLRPAFGRSCRRVAAAQRAVAARLDVAVAPADGHLPATAFGPDGFHPGPIGIAMLADRVDAELRRRGEPR